MSCCQKELSCMSDRTPTCIISHARSKARQDGFNIKLVYVNQKSEGQASNMRSVEFKLGGGYSLENYQDTWQLKSEQLPE